MRWLLTILMAASCWQPLAAQVSAPPLTDLRTRRTGDDWPAFLGPAGDSKSRETGILTKWPESGLRIVWQQPLGTGYGTPAISQGRLFVFARHGDVARLECWNSETAQPIWQFEYPTSYEDLYNYNNGPRCQPVVDGDLVYTYGAEGMLHCVRAVDGKQVWRVDTVKEFGVVQNFFGVGSTPVVFGDLLIVNVGGSPPEDAILPPGRLDRVTGNGTGIVAFDKRTGAVKYKLSDELASYASPKLATIKGRPWCFMFARGGLLGFDPTNGKQDFHFSWRATILESVNASTPVVVDDLVFISETYGPGSALVKARPGSSEVVWTDEERRRDKSMQTHWNTAVHHEGYVYGSSGRHTENAELRCIELKTGKVVWSVPGLTRSSLLYVDKHFICLTEYGDLFMFTATSEKFTPVAQAKLVEPPAAEGEAPKPLLKYPCWAAPILSHGLLYVRGNDRLLCLELIPAR